MIFGVGLIGGSVAMALKKAGYSQQIVGIDRNPASLAIAIELGVIDIATNNISEAMKAADLVLIATPVAQIPEILQLIKPHLAPNTVITDAGSTKSDVLRHAQAILGDLSSQFIGGHPIAGAEKSGVTAATADLYQDKNVVLTPTQDTSQHVISCVTNLWQCCGAKVSEMSAEMHDGIFATVSHLPHLLAFALVNEIALRPNAEQLFSFAASGFRDFTRIAGSHPEMWRDISLANKDALLNEIDAYEAELKKIKSMLQSADAAGLHALFKHASEARNAWANHNKNN